MDMTNKWNTLKHNGPVFPPEYTFKGLNVIVGGAKSKLSPDAEELVYAWAQKHATPYVKDSVFQKNFWSCLKPLLDTSLQATKFPADWDFSEFVVEIENLKESKKAKTSAEKKAEKEKSEARKAIYGFAELDGEKTPLGNYMVEPPGLFMGRGKHPKRGFWKARIAPEDIIINHSLSLNPPSPPAGHKWKAVEENKNSLFTVGWNCKLTGKFKPVLFSAISSVSHKSAMKKFTKAIELANNFDKVNAYIEKKLSSRDKSTRKEATVCELISKMSIRVGDEKGEDEADTVGATTLRVEHVKIDNTSVIFDFLGKDSVRYYNKVDNLDINAIRNIQEFMTGKKASEEIFDGITSHDVNLFLDGIIDGLTAKQFRTATGSTLLAKALQNQTIDPSLSERKKLEYYTNANLEVAIKLNHQTAVSEAYENSIKNMKDKLDLYKKEYASKNKDIKKEIDTLKDEMEKRVEFAKENYTGEKQKNSIQRAKENFKKKQDTLNKRVATLSSHIEDLESKIDMKKKTRGIALGTSKLNYSDPRIGISWCKDNGVDIKRLYTPALQARFAWAVEVKDNFYKKYPIV